MKTQINRLEFPSKSKPERSKALKCALDYWLMSLSSTSWARKSGLLLVTLLLRGLGLEHAQWAGFDTFHPAAHGLAL